jgi:hypothetical protein
VVGEVAERAGTGAAMAFPAYAAALVVVAAVADLLLARREGAPAAATA